MTSPKQLFVRYFVRHPRMWEPTGKTRIFWDQGGSVMLEGEERDRLSGKTRWRIARWLPLDEYKELLAARIAEWYAARSMRP